MIIKAEIINGGKKLLVFFLIKENCMYFYTNRVKIYLLNIHIVRHCAKKFESKIIFALKEFILVRQTWEDFIIRPI